MMPIYTVTVPGWRPATLNELMDSVRQRIRLKKRDRAFVGAYVRVKARVPMARGKRRVSVTLAFEPGERRPDPDAYWKSLLDALVAHGMLTDDGPRHCELGPVAYDPERQPGRTGTTIILEDIP